MERANSVGPSPLLGKTDPPHGRLPLSGGDPKKVLERIQKCRGAATDIATPANASVDLSEMTTDDLLAAFDVLEKSRRTLAEFFDAVADFTERGVNPRRAFADARGARERFRVLTVSASRLYQAFACASLARLSAERVLGISLADLGEAIVTAFDVLDYAGARDE